MQSSLTPYTSPALFITGTGTEVGKTVATAALAAAFRQLSLRVGICKPIASGCPKHPDRGNDPHLPLTDDDFLSPDATFAARAAGLDPSNETLLRNLSPLRYAAPLAPSVAARLENRPPNWQRLADALTFWQTSADLLLIEGAGGWLVPLDDNDFMIADLAAILRVPVLIVTDARLGSINNTLLTAHAIRSRGLTVAGIILNRVAEPKNRDLATLTNLEELPRLAKTPLWAILPELDEISPAQDLPAPLVQAVLPSATHWWSTRSTSP